MRPCGQRLSRLWLLPIIKRKKRPHPRLGESGRAGANQFRGTLWRRVRTSLPRPRRKSSPISPAPKPSIATTRDRKSTRLNSSHANISYAVFCLKKKKKKKEKKNVKLNKKYM